MMNELGAAGLCFERDGAIAWCIIDRPEARRRVHEVISDGDGNGPTRC